MEAPGPQEPQATPNLTPSPSVPPDPLAATATFDVLFALDVCFPVGFVSKVSGHPAHRLVCEQWQPCCVGVIACV